MCNFISETLRISYKIWITIIPGFYIEIYWFWSKTWEMLINVRSSNSKPNFYHLISKSFSIFQVYEFTTLSPLNPSWNSRNFIHLCIFNSVLLLSQKPFCCYITSFSMYCTVHTNISPNQKKNKIKIECLIEKRRGKTSNIIQWQIFCSFSTLLWSS